MSGNFDPNFGIYQGTHLPDSQQYRSEGGYDQGSDPNQANIFGGPPLHGGSNATPLNHFAPPPLSINLQFGPNFFGLPSAFAESPQQGSPNVASFFGADPEQQSPVDTKSMGRIRRKTTGDQVKHRRTRSGCYTCRSRRVKCDERRPVCDRCRKGSRDCVYPEPKSKRKSSAPKSTAVRKSTTESASEEENSSEDELEDFTEKPSASVPSRKPKSRPAPQPKRSESYSESDQGRSKSSNSSPLATKPPTPNFGPAALAQRTGASQTEDAENKTSKDQQFYLEYFQHTLTHHHYQFKQDGINFIHGKLLESALQYDPLRYAVVGFAAFHHAIGNPAGKISDFLTYYNQSVSLLRKSLQEGREHTEAMLFTILQLATFEEYLGDWVNLFGHQRAAHRMILELYTPQSLSSTPMGRALFIWYARFDLYAGLMAGNETTLGIEWFRENQLQWQEAADASPSNMDYRIESLASSHRYLAVEVAQMNARLTKGEIPASDYIHANNHIRQRIASSWSQMNQLLQTEEFKVPASEISADAAADGLLGPVESGQIMRGALCALNYVILDWAGIDALARYQEAMFLKQPPPQKELFELAMQQIRVIDRMSRWNHRPNGALIPTQASLTIISLFIPAHEGYMGWCRDKFAKIESHGYIFPPTIRRRLAEAWSIPSLERWWLLEEESCPPIILSLRTFIDERLTKPPNQMAEDIRAMRALFQRVGVSNEQRSTTETIKEEDHD